MAATWVPVICGYAGGGLAYWESRHCWRSGRLFLAPPTGTPLFRQELYDIGRKSEVSVRKPAGKRGRGCRKGTHSMDPRQMVSFGLGYGTPARATGPNPYPMMPPRARFKDWVWTGARTPRPNRPSPCPTFRSSLKTSNWVWVGEPGRPHHSYCPSHNVAVPPSALGNTT